MGRAWIGAAALMLGFGALLQPTPAHGQDDEVIVDPELAGPSSGSTSSSSGSAGAEGEEIIADPELGGAGGKPKPANDYGWGDVYKEKGEDKPPPVPPPGEEPDPLANTGIGHLELAGQTAIDVHNEGSLEDFYEARLRFGGEIEFRLSRKLRLALGTRIDFGWYAPHQNDPALKNRPIYPTPKGMDGMAVMGETRDETALDQDRYELDIVPLAAYLDTTLAAGLHLRVGSQVVSLGRMDGMSVVDMLAVLDFRPQARADIAGLKLAQPAVRLDWDMSSWATLQLVYVPWFMPHLMRPNRDRYVGGALTGRPKESDTSDAFGRTGLTQSTEELINPSWQTRASESSLRFVGPAPDFSNPQAEARVNFRGSSFEVALLAGTALEKLPAIYYAPVVSKNQLETPVSGAIAGYMNDGFSVASVEYHRYYLVGFDGSFDIAPLQFGFEFGFSPSRHFYTQDRAGMQLPLPDVTEEIVDPSGGGSTPPVPSNVTDRSIRKGVPMLQAALHAEYFKGEVFGIVAEAYLYQAFKRPHNVDRDWLGFGEKEGTYLAGLIGASYSVADGRVRFDASFLAMMGPSFLITPQIEVKVVEGFFLNLGSQIYEGPPPNNFDNGNFIPGRTATNLTLGGVLSGYDNIYLGFRWVR